MQTFESVFFLPVQLSGSVLLVFSSHFCVILCFSFCSRSPKQRWRLSLLKIIKKPENENICFEKKQKKKEDVTSNGVFAYFVGLLSLRCGCVRFFFFFVRRKKKNVNYIGRDAPNSEAWLPGVHGKKKTKRKKKLGTTRSGFRG